MEFTKVVAENLLLHNRYRTFKLIGQSRYGKTFLGVDENQSPPIPCVIKQFLCQNSTEENFSHTKALFQQQAHQLEELGKHPQIPTLLAQFEQDECLYLVHEFIDGSNLAKLVEEEGTCSETQIWQLLNDLLPVLKFIHDRQVIHGDIKPENIIRRTLDGGLVLVDFSVGQAVRAVDELSLHSAAAMGSPEYVAPEQARGKAVFASDLYSLGVTCIYLLTHIPPFDLFDIANDRWAWRQYAIGDVSDRLCTILDKLLQNAVNQRFQSADEVMLAINLASGSQAARNATGTSSPTSTPSQPWQCMHTLRVNSSVLKSVNSVAITPDGQLLASGGDDKIIRLWNSDTGQVLRTFPGHSQAVNCVTFSFQGNLLASASDDKTIKLWNYETEEEIFTLAGHSHAVKSVAFSPDSQILASGSWDKTIKLWDASTGAELCSLSGHKLQVSAIAFSPDGRLLASASFDRTVRLYLLPSSQPSELRSLPNLQATALHTTLSGHCGHVFCVAFSPDGKTIATGSNDNTIKLWDTNSGQATRTLLGHSWSVVAVAFSPDGETLLSGSWDKTVKIWKVSTGEKLCTLFEHTDSVCAVAISSTNKAIASGSKDKTVKLWLKKEIKN